MSERGEANPYDPIASLYDRWNTSVVEDIDFYVEEARASCGPVLELGVGTGRIAVPIALAGVPVIGIDTSVPMLERCRERAESAGVGALIDLRLGDLRNPPVTETVPLAISPFRAFLHLQDDGERLATLERIRDVLQPGGRFIFDVFAPSRADISETHGRWVERERGIEERADWDERERTLVLRVRGEAGEETSMRLAWISAGEWTGLIERAGMALEACYGWFDRRPYSDDEDMVFVARSK
jgi:SAM-dependent methyltransferase